MSAIGLLEGAVKGAADLNQQAERERPGKTRQRDDQQDDGRLELPPTKIGQRLSNDGAHWTATRLAPALSSATCPSISRITPVAYCWAIRGSWVTRRIV